MDEMPAICPVFTSSIEMPEKIRATWIDWIKYYIYNWTRKPFVIIKQREMRAIENTVFEDFKNEVVPKLKSVEGKCIVCTKALYGLQPCVFLSTLESSVRNFVCVDHPKTLPDFVEKHKSDFARVKEISKWINGF